MPAVTPSSAVAPSPAVALARLSRRLGSPVPAPWASPPLAELIGRIDAALAQRRTNGTAAG